MYKRSHDNAHPQWPRGFRRGLRLAAGAGLQRRFVNLRPQNYYTMASFHAYGPFIVLLSALCSFLVGGSNLGVEHAFATPGPTLVGPSVDREEVDRNENDIDLLLEEAESATPSPKSSPNENAVLTAVSVTAASVSNTTTDVLTKAHLVKQKVAARNLPKYPAEPCSNKTDNTAYTLTKMIDSAGFRCADELVSNLKPKLQVVHLKRMLVAVNSAGRMRARWNALYALGKFCFAGEKLCGKDKLLPEEDPAKLAVFHKLLNDHIDEFQVAVETSILNEHSNGILKSAISIASNGNYLSSMKRQPTLRQKLAAVANDSTVDDDAESSNNERQSGPLK